MQGYFETTWSWLAHRFFSSRVSIPSIRYNCQLGEIAQHTWIANNSWITILYRLIGEREGTVLGSGFVLVHHGPEKFIYFLQWMLIECKFFINLDAFSWRKDSKSYAFFMLEKQPIIKSTLWSWQSWWQCENNGHVHSVKCHCCQTTDCFSDRIYCCICK